MLEFLVVWLGAVVRSPSMNPHLSGVIACFLITAAAGGALVVIRRNRKRWTAYYPWLLILGFALASGAVTAIGRVNIGIDSVFNTSFYGFSGMRYNLTSVFVYVSVIGLLFNLYQDRIRSDAVWRRRFLIGLSACCLILAGVWIEMLSDESIRLKQFQASRRRARTAVIWSNVLPANPEIFLAYPYPDLFWKRVKKCVPQV